LVTTTYRPTKCARGYPRKRPGSTPNPKSGSEIAIDTRRGGRYEGDFVEGKKHEQGVCTGADGSRYEGDFVEGKPHGKGGCTGADGSRYEGVLRGGQAAPEPAA
jgi:hypothetical protein